MQPKSSAMLFLFSSFLTWAVAGCTPGQPSENESPKLLAGKTVRVACPSGPSAAVVRTYSRAWANREGVNVEVLTYDPSARLESVGIADVWVVPPAALSRRAAADELLPVPTTITGPDSSFGWTDLLPIYKDHLLLWRHTNRPNPVAVPLMGESPLCIYRADLFADAARAAVFEKKFGRKLAAPVSWEEFADLAEHFRDTARVAPGKTKTSLPPLPTGDAILDREFFTIAACYARRGMSRDEQPRNDRDAQLFSFQYDHETGAPRLATPGFIYALNLMNRLQDCRPKGVTTNIAEAFRDDGAVLALADMSVVAALQKEPTLRDKIGIWRMPGGGRWFEYAQGTEVLSPSGNRVPYLGSGGLLAAVPRVAKEPDAAFSLLEDLCGRERSSQIVIDPLWGGGPTRREHLERSRWDAFGLEPAQTKALKDALRQTMLYPALPNPAVRLRTITEGTHETVLLNELRQFLTKGGDAAKVMATVSARWVELDREFEGGSALDDYRLSVGLLPKQLK
jgi:multiple sugar transport system substrate-binding protein